ncbi:MAG: hypothetical protein EON48_09690 [Acetobacteraceae bacterium]|nr:MAG: hypothetical protein EON48_09690 [Acetobacteraceae bacterium]
MLRTIAIVAAAVFAVATPVVQFATATSPVAETNLVRDGDTTLEAAGYAFSIWSLIYAGLIAYAVYQALPSTREMPGLRKLGWPSVIAMTGCGLWLIAAMLDAKVATVAIIVISAATLTVPLLKRYPVQHRIEFWLVAAPLSMLAGWLTIASAINALTVLTGMGVITAATAPAWATGGIVLVVAIAAGPSVPRPTPRPVPRRWAADKPSSWMPASHRPRSPQPARSRQSPTPGPWPP